MFMTITGTLMTVIKKFADKLSGLKFQFSGTKIARTQSIRYLPTYVLWSYSNENLFR